MHLGAFLRFWAFPRQKFADNGATSPVEWNTFALVTQPRQQQNELKIIKLIYIAVNLLQIS
jgi:hypothetical protein